MPDITSSPPRGMYPFRFERMPLHYLYHFKRYAPIQTLPLHHQGACTHSDLKAYDVALTLSISFQVVYYF